MKFNMVFEMIRKFFVRTFTCFSLLTLVMAFVGLFNKSDELSKYLTVNQIFTFAIISLFFALSFLIADFIKNNTIIRRCVQFVLTYASFIGTWFLRGTLKNHVETNSHNMAYSLLMISFGFVVAYVICALIVLLLGAVKKSAVEKELKYENVYKNVKKEENK